MPQQILCLTLAIIMKIFFLRMSISAKKPVVHYGLLVDDQENFGKGCLRLILKQYSPSPNLSHFLTIFKSYFHAILIEYIILEHGTSVVTVNFEVVDQSNPNKSQTLSTTPFNVDEEEMLPQQVNVLLCEIGSQLGPMINSIISKVEVTMIPNEKKTEPWQKPDWKMDPKDVQAVRLFATQLNREAISDQALECAEFLRFKFLGIEAPMSADVHAYLRFIEEAGGWRGDGKYLDLLIVACVAITHRRGTSLNLISSYQYNNAPLRSNSTAQKHYERLNKKGLIPDSILYV